MKKHCKLFVFLLGVLFLNIAPSKSNSMVPIGGDSPTKSHLHLEESISENPIVIKTDDNGRYVDIEHASLVPSEDLELKFRNHFRVKECIVTTGNMRLYFENEVNGTAQTEEEIMKFCNDYFNL